jgi:CRP-like cAMP-binding protein
MEDSPTMVEIHIFRNDPNVRQLEAGETLFQQGEAGTEMYAVIDGEVDLVCDGAPIDRIGSGGIVGEMALIDHSPRSATAVAATDARVVPIDKRRFVFLVQEHPTFALLVMETMAARIRRSNARAVT